LETADLGRKERLISKKEVGSTVRKVIYCLVNRSEADPAVILLGTAF